MQMVMETVDKMPASRGTRGYFAQAEKIRDAVLGGGQPFLAVTADSRNGLETLARHLKTLGGTRTVVAIHEKAADGTPSSYGLFVEPE